MNKKDIYKYKDVKNKTLTTSEVIRSSFVNVLSRLNKEDYVLVENRRQQKTLVVQDIDTFTNVKTTSKTFTGKVKTTEDNILLAKTFIKENIFFLMKFESKNITFPEISTILSNSFKTKQGFDAQITEQLMDGWKYVLRTPESFEYKHLLKLQGIIAKDQALEWGVLRNGKTGVTGTNYKPSIPTKNNINKLIEEFYNSKDKYKAAATLLVKLIKAQPFWDGNKRTSFLFVNKLLIERSLGILSLNEKTFFKFESLLNNYYNDEQQLEELVVFLTNNCFYNTKDKKLIR